MSPDTLDALIDALSIRPYGVETFTDRERGKRLTTLCFRHAGGPLPAAVAWIGAVLAELDAAGIRLSGGAHADLTPVRGAHADLSPVAGKPEKWRCYLRVPVTLPEGTR